MKKSITFALMRSAVLGLLIAAMLYQSFGLVPALDLALTEGQQSLRDRYTTSEPGSPFVSIRIPNNREAFQQLGFALVSNKQVSLNGVLYDIQSSRIFTDFIELRVYQNEADLLAKQLEKEQDKDANKQGMQSKLGYLVFTMMTGPEPLHYAVAPVIPSDETENSVFTDNGKVTPGYFSYLSMPPEA